MQSWGFVGDNPVEQKFALNKGSYYLTIESAQIFGGLDDFLIDSLKIEGLGDPQTTFSYEFIVNEAR